MEIRIESPHFKLGQPLEDFINAKVAKLEHIDERLIRSEVCLKLDKSSTDDNKICEIRVIGPQKNLFASHRSLAFEDAVIETVHALEEQLRRKKTKNEKGREKMNVDDSTEENPEE